MKWTVALTALTLLLSGGAALSAPGQPNAGQTSAPAAPSAAPVTKAANPILLQGETPDELLPLKPGTKVLPPPKVSKEKVEAAKLRALQMTPPVPRQLTQEEKDRAAKAQAIRMQEGLRHVNELKQEVLREEALRHPPAPPGLTLPTEEIANGYMTHITTPEQFCFRDKDSFAAFMKKHDRGRSVPDIDFKKKMVIAVFAGPRKTMGHRISVKRVAVIDKMVTAFLEETDATAANRSQAQMVTFPYDIVVVDRYDYPVVFTPNLKLMGNGPGATAAPDGPAAPQAPNLLAK